MAIVTVTGIIKYGGGNFPTAGEVVFRLEKPITNTTGVTVSSSETAVAVNPADGTFSATLESTTDAPPNDARYMARFRGTLEGIYEEQILGRFYLTPSPSSQVLSDLIGTANVSNENGVVIMETVATVNLFARNINNVRYAAGFNGADLGAKINAAFADLAGAAGEVWVDQRAGTTISTAVTTPQANQVLRFVQGGTYLISAQVNVSHLIGSGFGCPYIVGHPPVILKQANGSNLAQMFLIAQDGGSIQDVEIDGNKANNASANDGVICFNRGTLVRNVFLHDCKRHGLYWQSTTVSSNTAAIPTFQRVISYNNGGIGFLCTNLTDAIFEMQCEAELNTGYGIQLLNCPGSRIRDCDVAQNTDVGLHITGVTGQLSSRLVMVSGTQFGQNFIEDVLLQGHDGTSVTADSCLFIGNVFWGGANRADGAKSAILLINPQNVTIVGNVFDSVAGTKYKWGIETIDAGNSTPHKFEGNVFQGTFASGEQQVVTNKSYRPLLTGAASSSIGPASAYTQTYATADRTHANLTSAALTHGVGTADGTVDDVGAAFNQTTLNNNFKELTDQIAKLVTDLTDVKQLANAIIDDLQASGISG